MRTILNDEYEFLVRVERTTGMDLHCLGLARNAVVESMVDGGMGSIRFGVAATGSSPRHLGEVAAQGEFSDHDGVLVSFAVNLDTEGRLFELDVWRVDFGGEKGVRPLC